MTASTDALPDDPGTLKAMLLAERARAERLEQIIKELQRHRFGRSSGSLSCAGRSTAAVPAKRWWCRQRRQPG
jgi:hypothetical protein